MTCKLKIYDPILSYYLGRDSFEDYSDFKNVFENKLTEGTFPLSDKLVSVEKTDTGYLIEGQTLENVDAIIQLSLSNLLSTNDPNLQFARLVDTYEVYLNKYTQDYIDNQSKEQDEDFLKSLIGFYENFPVTDEFRLTGTYQRYLESTRQIKELLNQIDESLKVSDQLPTNESELWNPREEPYYIYTLTKLYKNSKEDVLEGEDELSVLRSKVIDNLSNIKGREFFVRLEPDTAENMQTELPQPTWKWGVVAVLYERVGNEYKRIYVKNDKGEITTDEKQGKEFGPTNSKNFTLTIPRFTGKEAYSKINLDARQALMAARDLAMKEPSFYYPLTGFNQEYPKGAPITLDKFVQDSNVKLSIASEKDRIFYAGNLYVEFENGEKAPTTRLPLNEQWQKLVFNLLNTEHSPTDTARIVNFLNALLSFKGGDVSFWNREGKIVVYRHAKKVNGKFVRVKEETPKEEIKDLLEYARINVEKPFLEEGITEVPYIQDGLKFKNFSKVDWEKFYKEHHSTIARQVQIGKDKWFGPIKSVLFNVESPITQLVNEQELQIQNPRLGDIEIEPDQEISVLTILDNIESLVNQTSGSTRDVLQILGVLSQENRDKFKDVKVVFKTGMAIGFKGVVKDNLITINYDLIPDINHIGDVLAHELIHQVTAEWLENNPLDPLTQRLKGLVDLVPGIPEYNRNIYELLASISNPVVAEQLKKIKIKDKSLLEEITDIIKDILTKIFGIQNVQKNDPNLYDELINKLIAISTKDVVRKEPETTKNKFGLKKRDVGNLPLGYDQASLDVFLDQIGEDKEDKTFLKNLVESIDADLAQYINNKGLFSDFIAGRLDFGATFTHLYNQYVDESDLIENPTKQQEKFFKSLDDFDFIKEYWIENTGFAKIKKDKVPKTLQEEQLEPVDYNESNDPTEVLEGENEEKEQEKSDITGGEQVNEGRDTFERTGTDTSSIDAADKLSRAFIKMIPALEKEKGKTKIYQEDEIDDLSNFIKTPYGYIKFKTNQLGRIQLTDYYSTWNKIAYHLSDLLSLEEMFDKIDSDPDLLDLVPEIYVFKDRLDKPITNPFQAEVRAKLETAFKRAKVDVYVVVKDEGIFHVFNESNDYVPTAKRQVNTKFLDNLKELEKFYDRDKGEFKIKDFLKTFEFEKNGEIQINRIEKDMQILPLLGFEFDPKTIKDGFITDEYRDFKINLIKFLSEFETIPVNIADFIVKDQKVGTKKIKGLNNFFKRVYELENKNNPLTVSLMVKNAEGENQSSLSTFNTLLQTKLHYNRAQTEEELNQLVPRTLNPLFKYSLTRNILFKQGERTTRKIEIVNLNGFKVEQEGSASKGALLIDLEDGDWIVTNFVTMLKNGLIENTRAETASTTYAFKLSDWNLNLAENRKTPFSIGEVQGIFKENGRIGFETQDSPIYQQWVNYLRGELERVKANGKPFGLFSDIFTKEEQDFLLANGIEQNVPMIQKALGDWFTNQYQEYAKMFESAGGLSSLFSSNQVQEEGKYDRELYKLIYPNNQDLSKQYQAFYAINLLTLHTEETILFQGDISESPKYFKRAKGVQSTGTPLSKSEELTRFLQEELNKSSFGQLFGTPLQVGDSFESATIKDDVKTSHYYESGQFQSGYIESKKAYNEAVGITQDEKEIEKEAESLLAPLNKKGEKEGYVTNNIGDGDAFINPDFYFYLLNKVGSINQDQITGYKALVIEFKKNIEKYLTKEQIQDLKNQGVDFTITEQEETTLKEGLKLIEKGKAIFPKLKCIYRGNGSNNETQVVQKEVMDKFALTPMFPQFTKGKPIANELLLQMLKGNFGYVKFESGTKIGSFGNTDFINQIESGDMTVSIDDTRHSLQEEFLREQIKTPEKVKSENTFGSQFRKLILSSLYSLEGKPIKLDNESNAGDLVAKWEQLNQQFSQLTKIEVLGRFGITEINGEWNYSNIDYAKVADILFEEAERRDLPENLKVYFDKYKQGKLKGLDLSNFYKYFEGSFGNQQIQALLASIIKKIAVQKLSGAQLVQISESIFDRQLKTEGKTRELGFYHFKEPAITDKDKIIYGHPTIGKTYIKEKGFDVISFDDDFKSDIDTFVDSKRGSLTRQQYKGQNNQEYQDFTLNLWKRAKDKAKKENKKLFTSNHIILTNDNKSFDKVINLSEEEFKKRLEQRGSFKEEDFNEWKSNIDKAISLVDKSKVLTTNKYLSDLLTSKVQAAECKVSLIGDFKNLFNLPEVKERITPDSTILDKTDVLNELLKDDNFVEKYKDSLTIIGYRIPTQGFNSMEVMVIREFLPSFYGPSIVCPPEITTQSGTDYDYDKLSVIFPSLSKDGSLNTKGKKGIQNEMIQTSKDILLDKINYHKLITPNTNSLVFGLLDEIFDQLGVSTKDARGTKIITALTNLQKFKAVKGKGLLGIAAVWNPSYTLMQRHGWTLNKDYFKEVGFGDQKQNLEMKVNPLLNPQEEIKIYNPLTKDGIAKQEIISQLINVTVDMPSDDKFGHSIFNKSDMGALIYSTSVLGYSFRDALYFFHQPIIYRYKGLYNSLIRQGFKNYQAKINAVYTLLNLPLPEKKNGNIDWTKAETNLYTQILPDNEKELKTDKIYSLTPVDQINGVKLDQQQYAVLSHYLLILDQAEQVRVVQSATNFDTSPDNSIQKVFKRQENYKKARNSNIINKEFINQIYTNSVISGLNISRILKDITTELFPILYSQENQNMFKEVSLNYRDTEKAFRLLSNDYLLSIVQNFAEHNNQSLYEIANQFLQGDKKLELVNQAEEIQEKLNKEGLNYRLLDILVINISKERKDKVFNQQLFLGFENSPEDKDRLTREFRQLLRRPDTRQFAENLAITGIIQSGYSKSPLYFSDIVPEEFISPILSQAFDKYQLLSDQQKTSFRGNFVRNFQELRAKSLGVKDIKEGKHKKFYPKEDYRLMDYRTQNMEGTFEEAQVVTDLELDDEGYTPYEEVKPLGLPSGQQTKTYTGKVTQLEDNQVFVFGSNPLGVNGNPSKGTGGAALVAHNIAGVKQGEKMDNKLSDSGKAWGITTVSAPGAKRSKTPEEIKAGIKKLYDYALQNPDKEFLVAYQGTEGRNLNGYSNQELADMFSAFPIPSNVVFEQEFSTLLSQSQGTQSVQSEQTTLVFTKGKKGTGAEISSYKDNLEYALTNPVFTSPGGSVWKRPWSEGQVKWRSYMENGIDFEGKNYMDVEEAYQKNKATYPIGPLRDAFMQRLLEIKLRTYPKLVEGIDSKGGLSYLTDSTHQPTKQNSHWETGGDNAFIELLTKAYANVKGLNAKPEKGGQQMSLFGYDEQSKICINF